MAAVTVVSSSFAVFGNKRVILAVVNCAATGDTYTTGLKQIDSASADPPSTTGVGIGISTVSGFGVLTFNYTGGGGMSNIPIAIFGF